MTALHLLFDRSAAYLGEVFSSANGAFMNAALTERGEEMLGKEVALWRTKGISVRNETFGTEHSKRDVVFGTTSVKTSDPQFSVALRKWAEDRQLAVVTLHHEALSCWERLVLLPFEGEERLALAISLSKATRPQLEKWDESLKIALGAN